MVRLRLTANLLQVEELANVRVDEHMMATARPPQLEPERLDEPLHVGERDVREIAASDTRKQPPRIHDATLPASTDGCYGGSAPRETNQWSANRRGRADVRIP